VTARPDSAAGPVTAPGPGMPAVRCKVNPLSYEVSALRWLLIGIPTNLALDTGVLVGATMAGITVASLLLPRLAR